jgi:putative ABC transport system permease protein
MRRISNLFHRRSLDRDMSDEFRSHVEMETDYLMRTRGLSRADATRAAQRSFGGMDRHAESAREARYGANMIEALREFRFSIRSLARSPRFTIPAVATLAVAIGTTTGVYSVVRSVLLRALPFDRPEQLMVVHEVAGAGATRALGAAEDVGVSVPTYEAWQTGQQDAAVAAFMPREYVLTQGNAALLSGAAVTPNFFDLLGRPMLRGRAFTAAETQPGSPSVAVVSEPFWRAEFGSDPTIIGRSISLRGKSYQVVGVAARGFAFPEGASVWTPLQTPDMNTQRIKPLHVLARLSSGKTSRQATATLASIASHMPGNDGWTAAAEPLQQSVTESARRPLLFLLWATCAVLLVGVVNVSHLLLTRSLARRHELAIRNAIGAARADIIRELLIEATALGTCAAIVSVPVTYVTRTLLVRFAPFHIPQFNAVALDWPVWAVATAVTITAAICASVAPSLAAAKVDVSASLAEGGAQRTPSRRSQRLRRGYVVAQVAVTMVLLGCASVLLRSFHRLSQVDPGFNPANVVSFDLHMPQYKYQGWAAPVEARQRILREVRGQPGVLNAGLTESVPLSSPPEETTVQVDGRSVQPGDPAVVMSIVSPGYFASLGIPVKNGRDFEDADADRSMVAIVNEAFARAYFPNSSPIGKNVARALGGSTMRQIVGVVADVRQGDIRHPAPPMLYTHASQEGLSVITLVVRSKLPTEVVTREIRSTLKRIDGDIAIGNITTLRDIVGRAKAQPRFYALGAIILACIAMLLAVSALYSALVEDVILGAREFGIRLALGARPAMLVQHVVAHSLTTVVAGIALGTVGWLAAARTLDSVLYDVSATDLRSAAVAAFVLIATSVAAAMLPARRAGRTDPVRCFQSR